MSASRPTLDGIKVLDLSRVLAGPWATQILAELGADVVKIERPGTGDEARGYGSTCTPEGDPCLSGMFMSANRNKRSVAVDFSDPEGGRIVRALASETDIVVENYLPGTLARYRLDYPSLREANPGLIYCSISGYGQTGPYRDRPGYDAVFQAYGGLMSVTGHPDGAPGGGPMKVGPSVVDVTTGFIAVIGILAALRDREADGGGRHIDASLLDGVLALQSSLIQSYLAAGAQRDRQGNSGNGGHPAGTFDCADGPIYLSIGNDRQYAAFCALLGRADLADDPSYATSRLRFEHRDAWNAAVAPLLACWTRDALVGRLADAGVPAASVNDYRSLFADPHLQALGLERRMPNPLAAGGTIPFVQGPIRRSDGIAPPTTPPPLLGQHTDAVLRALGLSGTEIGALRARGVIENSNASEA